MHPTSRSTHSTHFHAFHAIHTTHTTHARHPAAGQRRIHRPRTCRLRQRHCPRNFNGVDITGASYAQDFRLTDPDGRERTLADFKGKAVMLFFGFTQCPDVCPTALAARRRDQAASSAPTARACRCSSSPSIPSATLPVVLKAYTQAFDPSFIGLYGDLQADQPRPRRPSRPIYKKVPTGSSYTMDHSAFSYVYDPEGQDPPRAAPRAGRARSAPQDLRQDPRRPQPPERPQFMSTHSTHSRRFPLMKHASHASSLLAAAFVPRWPPPTPRSPSRRRGCAPPCRSSRPPARSCSSAPRKTRKLVSASSPVTPVVEVHEMAMQDGVMRMRQVPALALPAGKTVELRPGGYHVMLLDLKQQVKEGDTVPLTLVFEGQDGKRETLEVKAPVRALNASLNRQRGGNPRQPWLRRLASPHNPQSCPQKNRTSH
jgi:protein SCO1/2